MDIYRLEYITLLIDINTSHNTLLQRSTCAPPFSHNFTQHADTHGKAHTTEHERYRGSYRGLLPSRPAICLSLHPTQPPQNKCRGSTLYSFNCPQCACESQEPCFLQLALVEPSDYSKMSSWLSRYGSSLKAGRFGMTSAR